METFRSLVCFIVDIIATQEENQYMLPEKEYWRNFMSTSRENEINEIINQLKEDYSKNDKKFETRKVTIKGQIELLDVFPIPLSLLRFNIRNGRFKSELLSKEREFGRELDPNDKDDDLIIQQLLLAISPKDTKYLKQDLKKYEQRDPGLMTYDGFVIDGNRRMAVIREIFKETENSKYGYLNVHVLPKSLTEEDLWDIETESQMARDFKVDYSSSNQLLKIAEGLDLGKSINKIADKFREDPKKIKTMVKTLDLVNAYLDYIEMPGEYKLVDGKNQHFIDAVNQLNKLKLAGFEEIELNDSKIRLFEILKGDTGYAKIRKFSKIMLSDKARKDFCETTDKEKEEFAGDPLPDENDDEDNDDEDNDDEDKPTPPNAVDSPDQLLEGVKAKAVQEAYEAALDILKYQENQDKPQKLLESAINALSSIDIETAIKKKDILKPYCIELSKEVERIKELLEVT